MTWEQQNIHPEGFHQAESSTGFDLVHIFAAHFLSEIQALELKIFVTFCGDVEKKEKM